MSKNDGGPAYPVAFTTTPLQGVSLRDYFAAKALQGLCADPSMGGTEVKDLANQCYVIADAMLKEREE